MAKAKNKLFLVLTLVALIALGTVLLASCDQTADSYTVTFMVRENGTGEYQQYGNPVQSDKEGKTLCLRNPKWTVMCSAIGTLTKTARQAMNSTVRE